MTGAGRGDSSGTGTESVGLSAAVQGTPKPPKGSYSVLAAQHKSETHLQLLVKPVWMNGYNHQSCEKSKIPMHSSKIFFFFNKDVMGLKVELVELVGWQEE